MKNKNKKIIYLPLILVFISLTFTLSLSLVSAIPGIPHQFYGSVTVNGQPAPDNNIITAVIEGDTYVTVTTNGKYGYSPNIFYVEDPEGNRKGTITFYVGGKQAGTAIFGNNDYTNLNFDLTTTCGDGYCLGEETCSSCQNDCGVCTDPPVITIISPEQDKVYDTSKIDLKVSADQNIIIWLYALNDADPVTFTPNITLTLDEGNHKLEIIGLSKLNYLSGSRTVSFSIDLPEPAPPSSPSGGGGGGGSSGGGGGGSSGGGGGSSTTAAATSTTQTSTTQTTNTDENQGEGEQEETQEPIPRNLFNKITGAVIGGGTGSLIGVIIFIAAIAGISAYVYKKRKEK